MTLHPERSGVPCAQASSDCGEPLSGTASPTRGWLLIEQPGAWGPDALMGSGFDPEITSVLRQQVAQLESDQGVVRIQLIRRPHTAARRGHGPRSVYLVHSGATPWVERLPVSNDSDLLDVPVASCLAAHPSGLGVTVPQPLMLVCTHGSRDRCCAEFGRPVAQGLWDHVGHGQAAPAAEVWETSHIGGHRFAGNLAILPEGLVYGRLDAASAITVADAFLAGNVVVEHLRGRSGQPVTVQAAEIFARRRLGIEAVAFRHVATAPQRADGTTEVTVEIDGHRVTEQVRATPLECRLPASCGEPATEQVVIASAPDTP